MKKSLIIIAFVILLLSATKYSNAQVTQLDKLLQNKILSGNVDSVKSVIKVGIDVNKRFNFGASGSISPLYLAIVLGYSEVAKLLIDSGANAKMKFDGTNLLHIAALYGGNEAIVELLIKKGLDVNPKVKVYGEAKDMAPLHIAAGKGNFEVATALIKNGADVNAKTNDGKAPLDLAIINKKKEMVDLFKKYGGKPGKK